jgi:hypothetical protein
MTTAFVSDRSARTVDNQIDTLGKAFPAHSGLRPLSRHKLDPSHLRLLRFMAP